MTKVNFKISVIALAIGMVMVSCGGGNKQQQSATTSETKTEAKADDVYSVPKDKFGIVGFKTQEEKDAVWAEVPQELLKAIGKKLGACQIGKSYDANYKYSLTINTYSDNGKADFEKLIAYYKSIGGTVEEPNAILRKHNITFPYAESIDVWATESAITIQFNVVKQ